MTKKLFPMALYIAGPMTGFPELNYPAFRRAEKELLSEGYRILNPARNKGNSWTDFMRESLRQLSNADGVYFLRGWKNSKGAKLEHHIATELGLMIRYEEELAGAVAAESSNLRSLQADATADFNRELLRQTEVARQRTIVNDRDLRMVLQTVGTLPASCVTEELGMACKRLQSIIGV